MMRLRSDYELHFSENLQVIYVIYTETYLLCVKNMTEEKQLIHGPIKIKISFLLADSHRFASISTSLQFCCLSPSFKAQTVVLVAHFW